MVRYVCQNIVENDVSDGFHALVGMYSLNQDEYDKLPLETAQIVGTDDQYLVTIEVFHQLHCLVRQYFS
jgi:hypothetical protein